MAEAGTVLATIPEDMTRTAAVYDRIDAMQFIETMGKAFAISGAGGCKTVGDGQVMALACLCQGKTVFEIARRYHLIEGKLGLKSEAMLSDFRQGGGKHQWLKDGTDGIEASLKLTGPDGQVIVCSMTIERAKTAGYVKGGSNWAKRPDQMLRARCITDGIRMGWPEIAGDYSVEEIEDGFVDYRNGKNADIKPKTKEEVAKRAAELKATANGNGAGSVAGPVVEAAKIEPAKTKPVETDPTIIDVEHSPVVVGTKTEESPFDVGQSVTEIKGDADESDLPTSATASAFTASVLELQILIPQCGWTEQKIIELYNSKWSTNFTDLGEFSVEQQGFMLEKIRAAHEKHQAKLAEAMSTPAESAATANSAS